MREAEEEEKKEQEQKQLNQTPPPAPQISNMSDEEVMAEMRRRAEAKQS